jgi:DNA-binding MarR family transcriptional regulator
MPVVPAALSYELHKLTARLDRAADGLLRGQEGVSYSRFLALFAVSQGAANQRELARWLGQTEPSTSRMVGVLAAKGWLSATTVKGAGNRRRLQLTDPGFELVDRCGRLLENRFEDLVKRSGVPYGAYQRHTRRLLSQLDADQQVPSKAAEAV